MDTNKEKTRNPSKSVSQTSAGQHWNTDDMSSADKDVSGNDRHEAEMEERRHHQEHGNIKYESNTNHASANDQPQTTTDTNLGRDLNSQ